VIQNMLYNITNPDFRAGADIEFDGRIVAGNEWFVISFPGIHKKHWDELIKKGGLSTCCVFFPGRHAFFGIHVRDPASGSGKCYCEQLYGGERPWGCKWFERWVELLLEGLAQDQQPIVLKQSKNHPLANHPRRLGFSQEGEVAYAKRYLEQHKPGVRMRFQDVDRFDGLALDAEQVSAPAVHCLRTGSRALRFTARRGGVVVCDDVVGSGSLLVRRRSAALHALSPPP
jgi:hypothetical protein